MRFGLPWVCWMLPSLALAANTPTSTRTPAEELEAQLAEQVKIPEPELVVITDGPDPARFELLDATVELDGRPVPGKVEPGWGKELFRGPVVTGNHVLTAQFAYRGSKIGAYPWSGSFTFRVPGKVEFQAQRGLRLVVHLRVEVHEEQEDVHNRLAFRAALEPEMTAKVDDAPMPPPPPKVLTPEDLAAPLASVPENPPPAPPAKTKKKPKKKTSVAAAGASLDVATARLQKAIATPGASPAPSPKPKTTASAGKSSKSKGLPDAGPIKN